MRDSFPTVAILSLLLSGAIGCSDDQGSISLNNNDSQFQDGEAACTKFQTPAGTLNSFPSVFEGTLDLASSSISVIKDACADEQAPYGVEVPGPDAVLELTNLAPGQEYNLRLLSGADLAMYVSSSCAAEVDGASASGCMLFVDNNVSNVEKGSFMAPDSGTAYVVVDYFLNASPLYGDFAVEVYATECTSNDQCDGYCVDKRCAECVTSFDCTDPGKSVCDTSTNTCIAGEAVCNTEDSAEGPNDGPAGATDVTPVEGNTRTVAGAVCNFPQNELDFFSFSVAENGEHYSIELDWADADRDLELTVFNSAGKVFGASLWQHPERVDLTYLAAGTYYISVDYYSSANIADAYAYTVTVTRQGTDSCESAADCAGEFDTQLYRGDCSAGACNFIQGEGTATKGQSCDSNDDCSSGQCSTFTFTADADTRSVCTEGCDPQSEINECGEGFVCAAYLINPICVPACDNDLQCAINLGSVPSSGAWAHLTCGNDGNCSF